MIRLARPDIQEDDLRRVREILLSGQLVQGAEVRAFEQAIAQYVGVEYAVAVSNCTSALYLSLHALGAGVDDLVVVAAYSWPATGNVVVSLGATPVFVDVDAATYNINPRQLERTLIRLKRDPATASRVKAVIPVHAFGLPADMPAIDAVCRAQGVPVVEDAACALGAEVGGRKAGAWGAVGCFSFHPRKAITTGEGGMITTNDPGIAKHIRVMRNHGLDPDARTPAFVAAGFNMRLTEFQAALGSSQLARIDSMLEHRRMQAAVYDRLLAGTAVECPLVPSDRLHAYQAYVVRLPASCRGRQKAIIDALRDEGVETTIGTYLMPFTRYFNERGRFTTGDFPAGEEISERALALPLHSRLTEEEQATVTACLLAQLSVSAL